ncbi:hypothetical protein G6F24_013247 [Rhizopus arrhizus]|nr:hypothetical protein G6F24_013247 [Rhizopus arrhizus]
MPPAVVQGVAVQLQGAIAENGAAQALQVGGGDAQVAGACLLHGADSIAEGCCVDLQVGIAGQQAAVAVVQMIADVERTGLLPGGQHAPTTVVEGLCGQLKLAGDQLRTAVVGAAQQQVGRTSGRNAALRALQDLRTQQQSVTAGVVDAAPRVDHGADIEAKARGIAGDAAFAGGAPADRPVRFGTAAVGKAAAAVRHRLRLQFKATRERHASAAVVQLQHPRAGRPLHLQRATGIAQRLSLYLQGARAQRTVAVVQAVAGAELQIAGGFNAAAVVVQCSGNVEQTGCQRRRDRCGTTSARRTRTWRTRTWRAGAWRARSWSGTAAVTIAATRRRTGHIADAALQIAEVGGLQLKHLRAKLFDAAAAVAQRIGVHFDAPRVERAAAVVGILGGLQAQLALGTERPAAHALRRCSAAGHRR